MWQLYSPAVVKLTAGFWPHVIRTELCISPSCPMVHSARSGHCALSVRQSQEFHLDRDKTIYCHNDFYIWKKKSKDKDSWYWLLSDTSGLFWAQSQVFPLLNICIILQALIFWNYYALGKTDFWKVLGWIFGWNAVWYFQSSIADDNIEKRRGK